MRPPHRTNLDDFADGVKDAALEIAGGCLPLLGFVLLLALIAFALHGGLPIIALAVLALFLLWAIRPSSR